MSARRLFILWIPFLLLVIWVGLGLVFPLTPFTSCPPPPDILPHAHGCLYLAFRRFPTAKLTPEWPSSLMLMMLIAIAIAIAFTFSCCFRWLLICTNPVRNSINLRSAWIEWKPNLKDLSSQCCVRDIGYWMLILGLGKSSKSCFKLSEILKQFLSSLQAVSRQLLPSSPSCPLWLLPAFMAYLLPVTHLATSHPALLRSPIYSDLPNSPNEWCPKRAALRSSHPHILCLRVLPGCNFASFRLHSPAQSLRHTDAHTFFGA